jgi:histidine triad (HIT) family protein
VNDCLFCKMSRGDIPVEKVHDDADLFSIRDINPQAPTHLLIIPHRHIETIAQFQPSDELLVGRIYQRAAALARAQGFLDNGYRVVANCNRDAGQTVFHVHFHLLAGRQMGWPPG